MHAVSARRSPCLPCCSANPHLQVSSLPAARSSRAAAAPLRSSSTPLEERSSPVLPMCRRLSCGPVPWRRSASLGGRWRCGRGTHLRRTCSSTCRRRAAPAGEPHPACRDQATGHRCCHCAIQRSSGLDAAAAAAQGGGTTPAAEHARVAGFAANKPATCAVGNAARRLDPKP